MLTKGDKIKLVAKMGMFDNVGEVCNVIDVDKSGVITFQFGNGMHMGCMSSDEFEKYFVKYEEPKNKVFDDVEDIINCSKIIVHTVFDKCAVVACQLPNGFVIVESESTINTESYDEEECANICIERIIEKVCEMEMYKNMTNWLDEEDCCEDCECGDCNSCDCEECECDCEYNCDDAVDADDCDGDCANCNVYRRL